MHNADMSKKKSSPSVTHYRAKCIGCALCASISPKYWRISDEDGLAELINGTHNKDTYTREIDIEDVEDNRIVAQGCPVNIIKLNE